MTVRPLLQHLGFVVLTAFVAGEALADSAAQQEYEKQVKKANLENYPENHRSLADWCKRRYPLKYQFHFDAWQAWDFGRMEKLLPASPSAPDLKRMVSTAEKMGMRGKEREYREKWGETQFAIFAKRLQPENTTMMKQLLNWAIKEKVDFIPSCKKLAGEIIAAEPEFEPARRTLQHLKTSAGWQSRETALAAIDLQNVQARQELHRALAEYRPVKIPADYPANPTAAMEKHPMGGFRTSTRKSGGEAIYFLWVKGYQRDKPCPLVINFHGGGEGGREKSIEYALYAMPEWEQHAKEGSWVVISPTVKHHVANSWWNKDNLEDVFDMIDETVESFNIDRRRIYITGQSMGGNGTGEWMWAFPELAAASCARAGAYWTHWKNVTDVLRKPIMVVHGEKDESFRNKSRDKFIQKTEEAGGVVTHISYPETDHFIMSDQIFPKMIPFFQQHVNDMDPDFDLLREVFRDRHKKYPQPYDN